MTETICENCGHYIAEYVDGNTEEIVVYHKQRKKKEPHNCYCGCKNPEPKR